jgi:hypothetical protein
MKRSLSLHAIGLLTLALPAPTGGVIVAQGSGVLLGIVGDTAGKPLAEVEIVALRAKRAVRTNGQGIFVLALPAGEETLIVRRIGFLPQTFDAVLVAGDSTRVGVNLAAASARITVLPDLVVEAEGVSYAGKMTGFADRMLHRGVPRANFFTRKDIEASGLTLTVDLLMRAGLKLREDQRPDRRMRGKRSTPACPRGQVSMRLAPRVAIFVDGIRMNDDFDVNSLDISEVEAVEVYRSAAQVPPEYNVLGYDCTVLFWLRGGT